MRIALQQRMIAYMSFTKELFLVAVAVCALVAFVSPTRAQDAGKEASQHQTR